MTPHHDHMGANAHYGRAFVKYAGNIHRPGDGMIPDIEDEHDGWWIYWMVPEGFLQYKEYESKHIAGCGLGHKGAITIKLLMAAEESAYLSVACGLSVLEHVATHGTAALGKVPYVKPRTQPQIAALWYRWGKTQSGPPPEEMSEEECNARFAAGRKAQAEAEAEKARVKAEKAAEKAARDDLSASQALAAAAREGLTLVPADNATGFMCVSKDGNQFKAEIQKVGVREYLGNFATPEEAALIVAKRLGIQGSAAAAAAAAGKGSSRKRPAESMAPPESLATTSRSGRRVQAPRRE